MMKCDTCIHKKFHSGGSWQSVAEGCDDPYNYEYCQKGHWEGGGPEDLPPTEKDDPWKDCKDYTILYLERIQKPEGEYWDWVTHSYYIIVTDRKYIVDMGKHGDLTHVVIRRRDTQPICNYFDIQMIKDKLIGEDEVAVQVFPKKKDMMNGSNAYHIWSGGNINAPNMVEYSKTDKIINKYGDSREIDRGYGKDNK